MRRRRRLLRERVLHLGSRLARGSFEGTAVTTEALFEELKEATKRSDPAAFVSSLEGLKERGAARLFASYPRKLPSDRQVELLDLASVGLRTPEQLVRLEDNIGSALALSLLFGLLAAVTQAAGFWVTLGLLSASLGSIWVGAFAPQFLPKGPEEAQRLQTHEAAHFLVGYLLGVPIRSYSVDAAGRPSVEFDDRIGPLAGYTTSRQALDVFCVVACSGIAGEGQLWDGSQGGLADLEALGQAVSFGIGGEGLTGPAEMANFTRWGVFYAASMLRAHRASWFALKGAMAEGADLCGCIKVLEAAAVA